MPKLILHGGIHRTGSTSIQKYLAANRQALAEQGFSYPGETENHQEIAWALLKHRLRPEQLASAISAGEGRTVILSAEDFCRLRKPQSLERLTAGFQVQAVFFVRRQDDWMESWYNQNVKWPFHPTHSAMSPLEFLGTLPEYYWLDYDALFRRWKPFCEKLDLVLFDEIEDSIDAFCGCANIDQSRLAPLEQRANTSLGPAGLEIVRQLGMYKLSQSTRSAVVRTVRSLEAKHPEIGGGVFPASVRQMIMERFERSNRKLSVHLGRPDPVLLSPATPAPAASGDLPDARALLRDFVAPLLSTLDRSARRKATAT